MDTGLLHSRENVIEEKVIKVRGCDLTPFQKFLFEKATFGYIHRDNTINSVLKGEMGYTLFKPVTGENSTSFALVCSGFVTLFGPADREILECLKPGQNIMPCSAEWFDLALLVWPDSIYSTRFSFHSENLDITHLKGLSQKGGSKNRIFPVCANKKLKKKLLAENFIDISDFKNQPYFLNNALVYVALLNDFDYKNTGPAFTEQIGGICWSSMINPGNMELSIYVNPEARKKSVATSLCACFLMESLKRGISVNWDAANPASKGLALKLGYIHTGSYRTLIVKQTSNC